MDSAQGPCEDPHRRPSPMEAQSWLPAAAVLVVPVVAGMGDVCFVLRLFSEDLLHTDLFKWL